MVAVTGRLEGSDLGTAISRIQSQLVKDVKLPPGMTVEYGGLYQEQQSSFRELAIALVLAVLLVFITLLIEFRSYAHPIAIVTGAVLALSGVLLALFITGSTLNVVSLMGMIMIVGIVAKNGILMLDAVEDHLAAGDTSERSTPTVRTTTLSTRADDITGSNAGNVASGLGDRSRFRTVAAFGHCSDRRTDDGAGIVTHRYAYSVCNI